MGKKRKPKEYDKLSIGSFLVMVRSAIYQAKEGYKPEYSYSDLTKNYKLGEGNTRAALIAGGFTVTHGKGFKNWDWTGPDHISPSDVELFIDGLRAYNKTIKRTGDIENITGTGSQSPRGLIEHTDKGQRRLFEKQKMPEKAERLLLEITGLINELTGLAGQIRVLFNKYH